MKKLTTLQKKIMRRVYYAYALRTVTLPGVPQGVLMFIALIALTYFVSIGNVIHNIQGVGMKGLGEFTYNAVTNTEAWTLLILGVFIFSAFSFRFKVRTPEVSLFSEVKA
jgi:hypothetical protein